MRDAPITSIRVCNVTAHLCRTRDTSINLFKVLPHSHESQLSAKNRVHRLDSSRFGDPTRGTLKQGEEHIPLFPHPSLLPSLHVCLADVAAALCCCGIRGRSFTRVSNTPSSLFSLLSHPILHSSYGSSLSPPSTLF